MIVRNRYSVLRLLLEHLATLSHPFQMRNLRIDSAVTFLAFLKSIFVAFRSYKDSYVKSSSLGFADHQ